MPIMKKPFEKRPMPFGFNPQRAKLGEKALGIAKKVAALRAAEERRSRTYTERDVDESHKPMTPEEELEAIRERSLGKLLKGFHPQAAEEIEKLIEEAMERNIDGRQMHSLLASFFKQRFPGTSEENAKRWVRVLLRVTHSDYAKGLKVE